MVKVILIIFAIGLIVFCFFACTVAKRSDEQSIKMLEKIKKEKDHEIQD